MDIFLHATTTARKLPLPLARGPLLDVHRQGGAVISPAGGWLVATRYPHEPVHGANVLVDRSHQTVCEVNGAETGAALRSICGEDVPPRTIFLGTRGEVYRLNSQRALLFGNWGPLPEDKVLDVTGGWASLALWGPDVQTVLNKVATVDLRESSLPCGKCLQGPLFGVVAVLGRIANRFELHFAADSARFVWDVLLDAGGEFHLAPVGDDYYQRHAAVEGA